MDNVGYVALSRAAMIERSTDITANNIANANTDGFRGKLAFFGEMVADTRANDQMRDMSYALDRGSFADLSEGPLTPTGNPLDLAIEGNAWFAFARNNGDIALGRNGNFMLDPEGNLVTSAGHAVLDAGGGPINIPAEAGGVNVAPDGTITGIDGEVIAQIGLFEAPGIENWQALDDLMQAPREGETPLVPALDARMAQGFSEGSNVNPILEMSRMIGQQRAFERAMNMADAADQLRRDTIKRLGNS